MPHYEMVNLASGNLVGEYTSEEEAFEDVRWALVKSGEGAMNAVGLFRITGLGQAEMVAEGVGLAKMAQRVAA